MAQNLLVKKLRLIMKKLKRIKTKWGMKRNRDVLIEELRTSILWNNISEYVEQIEQARRIVDETYLRDVVKIESTEISQSDDFYVTAVTESNGRIVIDFEMPLLLDVNLECTFLASAVGRLDIPDMKAYPYYKYDFAAMNLQELLSFRDIISIIELRYEDVEVFEEGDVMADVED